MIRKLLKKTEILLFAVLFLFLFQVAASAESQTHIGTSVPGAYSIKVEANGATVYLDGKSSDLFTVARLSQPRFLICPEANRIIQKVMLNETDITDGIVGGYYTAVPVCSAMTLRVKTVAMPKTAFGQHSLYGTLTYQYRPLSDVIVRIDSADNEYTTNADGSIHFDKLDTGHHTLTVIKSGIVIGYVEFVVENGAEVSVRNDDNGVYTLVAPQNKKSLWLSISLTEHGELEMKDAKVVPSSFLDDILSPKTGDELNMSLEITLFLISACTLASVEILKKRKKQR